MRFTFIPALKKGLLSAVMALFCQPLSWVSSHAEPLHVLGWLERVQFAESGIQLEAKLDSGADNSSLHAPDYEVFERNGEEWVRFRLKGLDGREAAFERPLTRWVRFVGNDERRPVILIGYCVGNVYREVEVNLTNRGEHSHQMLVGRSFLRAGNILLDANNKFTRDPHCEEVMER